MLSSLIIKMVQINIIISILEEFFVIKKVLGSDIFNKIICTIIFKYLAIILITIWILNLDIIKHIFDNLTRFLDLIDYKDFCYITNRK